MFRHQPGAPSRVVLRLSGFPSVIDGMRKDNFFERQGHTPDLRERPSGATTHLAGRDIGLHVVRHRDAFHLAAPRRFRLVDARPLGCSDGPVVPQSAECAESSLWPADQLVPRSHRPRDRPVISVKSDRHRGRFGRRVPFLLFTTPLAAVGMIGLGFTPILARWVHSHFPDESEMLVSLICFGVFWAAFEVATIAGQAVFGDWSMTWCRRRCWGDFTGSSGR